MEYNEQVTIVLISNLLYHIILRFFVILSQNALKHYEIIMHYHNSVIYSFFSLWDNQVLWIRWLYVMVREYAYFLIDVLESIREDEPFHTLKKILEFKAKNHGFKYSS